MDGPTLTQRKTKPTASKLAKLRSQKIEELRGLKLERKEKIERVAVDQNTLNNSLKNLYGVFSKVSDGLTQASLATRNIGSGGTSRLLYSLREKVIREIKFIGDVAPLAKSGMVPDKAERLAQLGRDVTKDFNDIRKMAKLDNVSDDKLKDALGGLDLVMHSLDTQTTQVTVFKGYVEYGVSEIKEIHHKAREIKKSIGSLGRMAKRLPENQPSEIEKLSAQREQLTEKMGDSQLKLNQNLSVLTQSMLKVNRNLAKASHDTKLLGTGALSRTFNGLREITSKHRDLYEGAPPRAEDGKLSQEAADLFVAALDLRDSIKEVEGYMARGLGAGEKPDSVGELHEESLKLQEILQNIIDEHDTIKETRRTLESVNSKARELSVVSDTHASMQGARDHRSSAAARFS